MISKRRTWLLMLSLYGAILVMTMRCSSNDDPEPIDCNTVNINVTTEKTDPSGCADADGTVTASATGGTTPYQYSINGGSFGDNNNFTGLTAGTYTVTVRDANGCTGSGSVTITAPGSTLNFTVDANEAGCKTNDGIITITATGGSGTYEYRLGTEAFGATNEFAGLAPGTYALTVRDSEGCVSNQSVTLTSGITYQSDIKDILDTNCAVSGCHVPGGEAPMSLQTFAVANSRANDIKSAVLANIMPKNGPPRSQELKDKIACWADDGAPED